MIAAVRAWLMTVVAAALLISLAESLIPEGSLKKIASLTGGLVLLLTLLQPVLKVDLQKLDIHYDEYAQEITQRQEELESSGSNELAGLIADKTEAYILDKAKTLGVDCTATVSTETGEDGVPIPYSVTLQGTRSEALAEYMEQELGIPRERQVWNGTESKK